MCSALKYDLIEGLAHCLCHVGSDEALDLFSQMLLGIPLSNSSQYTLIWCLPLHSDRTKEGMVRSQDMMVSQSRIGLL
jgi:hypothetical protein